MRLTVILECFLFIRLPRYHYTSKVYSITFGKGCENLFVKHTPERVATRKKAAGHRLDRCAGYFKGGQ